MSLEVNVAQVQDGRENPKDCRLVVGAEVQDLHGSEQTQEVLCVVLSFNSAVSALARSETTDRELVSRALSIHLLKIPLMMMLRCVPAHLIEVIVGLSFLQIERLPLLRGKTCQHLVEDVVVPLVLGLTKQT